MAFFVRVKMPNPPERLSAHQVYCKTLNLVFSASKQNIKNLVGNFGDIHVGIMYAKFQSSSFNSVGGGRGDRRKDEQGMSCHIANLPHASLRRDNNNLLQL